MTFEALKPLLDSGLINEDVGRELNEAWEQRLTEARDQVRTELREEFAQRYEHDKVVMVEALDRMVTESITAEIQAIAQEKQALAEDRVKFQAKIRESMTKFNDFLVTKLAEEITELRRDRSSHSQGLAQLEKFVVSALAEEITEFAQDKQKVVETQVRLVGQAREKLESLKQRFVKESADKLTQAVTGHLRRELKDLREDIQVARENNFGRRIFEAYAAEFGATHLNEQAEVRKLQNIIADKDQKLAEAVDLVQRTNALVETKKQEIRMIQESNVRASTLEELLSPLQDDKRQVMKNLLESVQTNRLKSAFEKYLPAVLETPRRSANTLNEHRVTTVTGDKSAITEVNEDNVIDLKRLAGL